jgi:acetylornithine deacetylase
MAVDPTELSQAVDESWCTNFLVQLLGFKSYGGAPGEADLARFLVRSMSDLGMDADLQPVSSGRFNAVGRWRGTGGGRSLLFNGHVDTNPVTSGWTVDPWGGLVRDGFIYGIGASNMKAGDAASFCAVKTLIDAGVRLPGDVVLTYVVGELEGGIGTLKAVEDGVRADCFINAEPTDLQALTLHAGAFDFVIELTGATRHLSKREEAVDAVAAACKLVQRINGAVFSGAESAERRLLSRANVGVLRGALTPGFNESRPAQVADFARLTGSARYAPSQSEESVREDLQRMLRELEADCPGIRTELLSPQHPAGRPRMLPFEVRRGIPVVEALNRSYEIVRGRPQPTGAIMPACLFWTDAAHMLHQGGMEGVVCGPGGEYNTMPDERVSARDFLDMIRIYAITILQVCS